MAPRGLAPTLGSMARTPLTLAATVASALPRVAVTGIADFTENSSGRYDSAVATLDSGDQVIIRVPVDADADADLRRETLALRALTPGVRAQLPFAAPDVRGTAAVDRVTAVVQTRLHGYRVDAGHIPAGLGVATAIAEAVAAIHELPQSVIRDAGLPILTGAQVHDEAERLLDRAEATGRLPFGLLRRWSTALATDSLWRFETAVVFGGVDASSFVLEDDEAGTPVVTGALSWQGLSVGDPAVDLRWVSSATTAYADIYDAYTARRPADGMLAERARLHAELEFAKWLLHGHESGDESIVRDAVALLEALDENVRDERPLGTNTVSIDEAMEAARRVPENVNVVDTSMHTDTYDPSDLETFTTEDLNVLGDDDHRARRLAVSAQETQPLERTSWVSDDATDPEESARNALRRWSGNA